jgi:hypothetical protein
MNLDTIKHNCQGRIRHLLHAAITDKLNKNESRANTAYEVMPQSYHRLLKTKKRPSTPLQRRLDPT